MRTKFVFTRNLIFIAFIFLVSCTNDSAEPYLNHPINGKWSFINNSNCEEIFEFLPSGKRLVVSNEERVTSKFEISSARNQYGVYELKDEVIFDNAKKDCSGSTADKTGSVVTLFVLIESKKLFFCIDEQAQNCLGPYVQMK